MKHEVTLYIADRKQNDLMRAFDLRPDYKWFISIVIIYMELPTTEKLEKIMESSKESKDIYIPAISCGDIFIKDEEVKILSDGNKEMFI